MSLVLLGVLGYVVFQFAIGIYVSRRIRTETDYLVAGRSLGYGLAVFTIFATWFGAETTIGAAGAIYGDGLSGATADPFGYGACLLVMGLVFAVPLWRRKLTTLADLFRQRFSPGVERLAVVLMIPTSLLWAAAQIRAFGQVLSAASGLEVTFTITAAALIVIAYTAFGGLLADAWTDLVQGIALIVGLIVLFAIVLADVGVDALRQVPAERLRFFGGPEATLLATVEAWAIPVCGSVLAAELVQRVIATRTPQVARNSSLIAGGMYLLLGTIPVTLGLMGPALVPGLEHPEQVLPRIAAQYLPGVLYVLFAGALVSAILSTVDSALLVASGLMSHNLIVPLRPGMTDAQKVRVARWGVATFGVLAYGMALYAEGVYALVEEASAFGSAGIFVALAIGLFSRWGGAWSAAAALLAGVVAWVLGAYVLDLAYPYLVSLAAALTGYAVAALAEGRPQAPVPATS
ncbi:MAG: sodium:solute symporter family protein [Gemmatimonadetes bacterium]|nr:sodium:solute symporter family protein [Gemmatimonadota bacterium]